MTKRVLKAPWQQAVCFLGGYPITPATEVAEHMSVRLPEVGGTFIQMEDEIAAMASILGASWAGQKSMTSTSGPGFSLLMENIGLGVCTETPCVVVNVQARRTINRTSNNGCPGRYYAGSLGFSRATTRL